jgi:hypothetical protein
VRKTSWIQCVVLLVLSGSLAFADDWKKSFTVSGKVDLRIDVDDGAVTIRAWDRNEIEAHITTRGWRIGPSEVRITDRQTGNRVEVELRTPRVHISFGNRSVHVELQVPRELRAEIHSADGGISAHGLRGEFRFFSDDGGIEAESVDGIVEAKTGDGRIRASGRWDRLDLQTDDGSIEADVRPGSKMTSSWRVLTGDGSITLRMPENFAADLDAHTGDGKITVDFPAKTSGSSDSDFRLKLNGGGESLVVRTGDGGIRVQRL